MRHPASLLRARIVVHRDHEVRRPDGRAEQNDRVALAGVGEGRFGNWLEENKDWSLSRDRFWGTPLPVWICSLCSSKKCVGSIAELREGHGVREPLDLHKPFVDEITFTCSCGGEMGRTPEVIDVWFDSGSMRAGEK